MSLLVAPVTAAEDAVAAWKHGGGGGGGGEGLELELMWWYGPHFSSEELDALVKAFYTEKGVAGVWKGMRLGVYRVKRSR